MLDEVLQAIKMLGRIDDPPREVRDTIDFLEQSVKARTKQNLLDLMAVGEVIGYDKLRQDLNRLAEFVGKLKEDGKG